MVPCVVFSCRDLHQSPTASYLTDQGRSAGAQTAPVDGRCTVQCRSGLDQSAPAPITCRVPTALWVCRLVAESSIDLALRLREVERINLPPCGATSETARGQGWAVTTRFTGAPVWPSSFSGSLTLLAQFTEWDFDAGKWHFRVSIIIDVQLHSS